MVLPVLYGRALERERACAAALCNIARQEMTFNHQHMTHFRTHLAQSLIDDSTQQSHVPRKPTTRKRSRTTATTEQQHPAKQTQHQPTGLTKPQERRMEGEREGDQRSVTAGNLRGRCSESVTLIKLPAPSLHCKV